MIVLGVTQIAGRLLDSDNPELVWLLRACHRSDNSRTPHSGREFAKTAVRRSVCGSPDCAASADNWPGREAWNCPPVALNVAEPQA